MLQLFKDGGFMMYPLLICSILSLSIIIERAINLRRRRIIRNEVVYAVENIETEEDLHYAIEICKNYSGSFANILSVALDHWNMSRDEIKEAILDQGRQEVKTLERGLVILETVAGIAPLLGLLGTVLGMIKVFTIISQKGVGQASALSSGIAEALITTATGLFIGIPALVFYNYFTNKAETIVLEIEKYSNKLLKKLVVFQINSL